MARRSIGDIRKPKILEHFAEVIKEEGIEGASIAKIAEHMGVHPSLILHYFKTKEEMWVELVDSILHAYEETFLSKVLTIEDPLQRFEALLNTLFDCEWDRLVNHRVYAGCLYLTFSNHRIKERTRQMYTRFREIVAEELRHFQEQGIVGVTDHERAAEVIIALIEGLGIYVNIRGDEAQGYAELGAYLKRIVREILQATTETNRSPT